MSARSGGKYRILAHLRGGDATETSLVAVESAKPGEGMDLAVLKRLKLGADAEPAVMERFKTEARICKVLDHPNLLKLLEAGMDQGAPVLVFEYVEGVTLARLRSRAVKQVGGVPKAIALRIVAEIAQGLAHAHQLSDENGNPLKVVHRDVSPENVIVTYDGEVKLTDFGMATTVESSAKSREDRVKGNVAYMAPEQVKTAMALDERADLFALGIILWELVTGKRLWEGLSEVDVIALLGNDKPLPSPRSVVPALPESLDTFVKEAMHKVRDERIESTTEFLDRFKMVVQKTGLKATAEEVGEFVSELFADERKKMREIVDEARATSPSEAQQKALPAVGAPPPPSDASPFVDAESDPRLRFGTVPKADEPSRRVIEVSIPPPPPPDRKFAYIMAFAAVVILGVAGIIAATSKPEKVVEEKPYEPPVRPTAATAAPSGSEYKEPTEVTIEIRVIPSTAKLFVDGVAVDNPHRTHVVPATFKHAIRAEAEGYETRTQTLVFDKERSVEIALVPDPKAKPGVTPPPPPPSAPKKPDVKIPLPPSNVNP